MSHCALSASIARIITVRLHLRAQRDQLSAYRCDWRFLWSPALLFFAREGSLDLVDRLITVGVLDPRSQVLGLDPRRSISHAAMLFDISSRYVKRRHCNVITLQRPLVTCRAVSVLRQRREVWRSIDPGPERCSKVHLLGPLEGPRQRRGDTARTRKQRLVFAMLAVQWAGLSRWTNSSTSYGSCRHPSQP